MRSCVRILTCHRVFGILNRGPINIVVLAKARTTLGRTPPYSAISAGGRAAGPASGRSSIVIMQIEAVVSSTAAAPNT
ncbi:hypothetical protein ACVILL_005471 [Bradyrhizobium sp. USDA 3364]